MRLKLSGGIDSAIQNIRNLEVHLENARPGLSSTTQGRIAQVD
jgi:hypothetical protein